MRVEVTQEHIDKGCNWLFERDGRFTNNCPIANALTDAIGRQCWACAGSGGIEGGLHFRLPKEVNAFIRAFDNRETVVPFAFDLDWHPEPVAAPCDSSPVLDTRPSSQPQSQVPKAQGPCVFWRPRIVREIEEMGSDSAFAHDDMGAVKPGGSGG